MVQQSRRNFNVGRQATVLDRNGILEWVETFYTAESGMKSKLQKIPNLLGKGSIFVSGRGGDI